MKIFVGTSGWAYSWNKGGSLDWYIENTVLNAVELNASFYRFPFPNQIKSWSKKGKNLRWAIKVNRLVTHVFKFGERGFSTWKKFERLFKPMDNLIDFYLFQAPPSFSKRMEEKVEKFFKKSKLRERFAFEARHHSWFDPEVYKWADSTGLTWVSIDSPDFPLDVHSSKGTIYIRMHGRTAWYNHNYSTFELMGIVKKIKKEAPRRVYVFFNNNHNMKANAEDMYKILHKLKG